MSRGVNKVILVGNLGKDPEVRYMQNGDAVANLTIATSESWTEKESGEKKEVTEWHRVTMFRKLGEIAEQYLKKGSQVYIEGKLKTQKYQDKETGADRYSTTIIADQMQMLGGKTGASQGQPQQGMQKPQQAAQQKGGYSPGDGGFDDFDDDIPFS